jgi:hypothetical protein
MKKLLFMLSIATLIISCNEGKTTNYNQRTVSITPEVTNLGDNLNLQALGELVKNSDSAEDIENKLNSDGSINNLDLNDDGQVDYVNVREYEDGTNRGFSFTVDLPNNEKQEIATIDLSKVQNDAQMDIKGNEQLYGNNGYHQSRYSLSDVMIMSYLFSNHRPYYSPYHYGHYPRNYHTYQSVPRSSYSSRISKTTKTTSVIRTNKPSTSSSNKVSSNLTPRAKTLSAPKTSQKSFTTTSASRQKPKTSGFSNASKTSKPSSSFGSSSSRSKPSSSKSSSWGSSSRSKPSSSKSSFGSSSRSSRSSRSSSSRSSRSSSSRR